MSTNSQASSSATVQSSADNVSELVNNERRQLGAGIAALFGAFALSGCKSPDGRSLDPEAAHAITEGLTTNTMVVANTIADLRTLVGNTGSPPFHVTHVLGYYADGDGGGGFFFWDAGSTASDDGGLTIQPTASSGAGRWRRVLPDGRLNVRYFGATGDSVTDDTAAVTAALSALSPTQGGIIYFPSGRYKLSSTLSLATRNTTIEGDSGGGGDGPGAPGTWTLGSYLEFYMTASTGAPWDSSGLFYPGGSTGNFVCNITIRNVCIRNMNSANTTGAAIELQAGCVHLVEKVKLAGWKFGVIVDSCNNVEISRVFMGGGDACGLWSASGFSGTGSAGIWIVEGTSRSPFGVPQGSNNIHIHDCFLQGVESCIWEEGGINHHIHDNYGGAAAGGQFALIGVPYRTTWANNASTDGAATAVACFKVHAASHITFRGNLTENNQNAATPAIWFVGASSGVTIEDNFFLNATIAGAVQGAANIVGPAKVTGNFFHPSATAFDADMNAYSGISFNSSSQNVDGQVGINTLKPGALLDIRNNTSWGVAPAIKMRDGSNAVHFEHWLRSQQKQDRAYFTAWSFGGYTWPASITVQEHGSLSAGAADTLARYAFPENASASVSFTVVLQVLGTPSAMGVWRRSQTVYRTTGAGTASSTIVDELPAVITTGLTFTAPTIVFDGSNNIGVYMSNVGNSFAVRLQVEMRVVLVGP